MHKKIQLQTSFILVLWYTLKRYAGVIDHKKIERSVFSINIIDEQFFTIYIPASPSPMHTMHNPSSLYTLIHFLYSHSSSFFSM